MENFDNTKTYRISRLLSQVARISAVVYAVDMLEILLNAIGISSWYKWNVSKPVAQVMYTVFFTFKLMSFKQRLLCQFVKVNDPEDLGPAAVYDRIANLLLVVVSGLLVLDMLSVQTGVALQSFFALGGVGTLVLSLGSKDLAAQFVSSLALTATGKFHEGELISLGDNTSGVVTKMGWMHTEIRGGDDIIVKIPNVQLASQRVSNISRMRRSQVQQVRREMAHVTLHKCTTMLTLSFFVHCRLCGLPTTTSRNFLP
jgi:small-conductance mechanosensitive channel